MTDEHTVVVVVEKASDVRKPCHRKRATTPIIGLRRAMLLDLRPLLPGVRLYCITTKCVAILQDVSDERVALLLSVSVVLISIAAAASSRLRMRLRHPYLLAVMLLAVSAAYMSHELNVARARISKLQKRVRTLNRVKPRLCGLPANYRLPNRTLLDLRRDEWPLRCDPHQRGAGPRCRFNGSTASPDRWASIEIPRRIAQTGPPDPSWSVI